MTAPELNPSRDRHLDRYRAFWASVDPAGLVVADEEAETTVAGCALASAAGAADAVARLDGAQFHDPRCWQAIDAAAGAGELRDGDEQWAQAALSGDFGLVVHGATRRVAYVAQATGLPVELLARWVTGRTVARDGSGWFAQRVVAAAEARDEVRALLDRAEYLDVDLSPLMRVDPLPVVMGIVADAAAGLGRELACRDHLGAFGAVEALIEVAEQLGASPYDAEAWVHEAFTSGRQDGPR